MKTLFASIVTVFVFGAGFAQSEINKQEGVAIKGYDPVAYFKQSKPVKGSKEFSYTWKDATWYFSSSENRNDFKSNPEKYAPQFGGYCAYGMADGHKAKTEPDAWTIVDGKLYLNYNVDVRGLWKKNQREFIQTANKNWPTVKNDKD